MLGLFVFFLCIAGIVFAIISRELPKKKSGIEKQKNVLQFKSNCVIVESPSESEPILNYAASLSNVPLSSLVRAIRRAKTDPDIKGISWEAENLSGGLSQLKDVRDALQDFKKSGKFIYAYGQNFSQKAYYVASVADILFLNPLGSIDIKGLAAEKFYYKNLSEKIGVQFSVLKKGKYKSALETYTESRMSKEDREQTKELLTSLWKTLLIDLSASRSIEEEKINQIAQNLMGNTAERAKECHLADQIAHYDEFIKAVGEKMDLNSKKSVDFLPLEHYMEEPKEKTTEKIAVLYTCGTLFKGSGSQNIQDDHYIEIIDQIKKDSSVKAVVVRINSPGGDAFASENLQRALLELKKKKPLIASFGDYAASGGYYIATAADYIFASPLSITGSIGAFGLIPNIKKLSAKIGLATDRVGTHKNSVEVSSLGELSPTYEKALEENIGKIYDSFIQRVSTGRKIPLEEVEKIAQGRVWSGKDALNKKLIDQLGTLDQAIGFAAKKAKLTHYSVLNLPRKDLWSDFLKDLYENKRINLNVFLAKIFAKKYPDLFQEVSTIFFSDSLQILLPFKVSS